jgi:hypothetical protein
VFAHRAEVEGLLSVYEQMARLCRENGWQSPGVAVDCNVDFMAPTILEVTEYERNHRVINVRETLTRLGECRPEEVFSALEQSDFVMLSKKIGARGRKSRFPFDRQMEAMRPELIRWCEGHCQELTRVTVFDREVVVYVVQGEMIRPPSNR